ncbi:MAG TPA: hypothetical protein VHA77_10265 [Xanthobacteraceae bacterium]|jgi:hypothetical protein|nr:hypothetical protein [Xanthobacteraceae bacterium]
MTHTVSRAAVALGLAGALAFSAATPTLARDFHHHFRPGVGLGLAAGALIGAAAASSYGSYEPGYAYGYYDPGYAYDYGPAYAYAPGPYDPGPFRYRGWDRGPVEYKAGGEAFSRSELGPGCSLNQKQLDRC